MEKIYARIWQYEVIPGYTGEFENAYKSDGQWSQLFRKSNGYLRTEFYRDYSVDNNYITVDYWSSEDSYNKFMEKFESEYQELDNVCQNYTKTEFMLGEFFC